MRGLRVGSVSSESTGVAVDSVQDIGKTGSNHCGVCTGAGWWIRVSAGRPSETHARRAWLKTGAGDASNGAWRGCAVVGGAGRRAADLARCPRAVGVSDLSDRGILIHSDGTDPGGIGTLGSESRDRRDLPSWHSQLSGRAFPRTAGLHAHGQSRRRRCGMGA